MKELLVGFLFALVLGSAINGCMQSNVQTSSTPVNEGQSQPVAKPDSQVATKAGNIVNATDKSFDQDVLASSGPVLVDFWATWCVPCKRLEPTLNSVASEYAGKLKVVKVDVDANEALVNQYRVNSMPTLMIFKNGKLVDKSMVGLVPKEYMEATVKKYID